jgi:hypothetical protein
MALLDEPVSSDGLPSLIGASYEEIRSSALG